MPVPVTIITSYSEYSPEEETTLGGETDVLVWGFNEYVEKDPTSRVYIWFVKSKYGEIYYREKKVDFLDSTADREKTIQKLKTVAITLEIALSSLFVENSYLFAADELHKSLSRLDSL